MRRPHLSFPPGLAPYLVLPILAAVFTPIDLWRRCRHARRLRNDRR